MWILALLLYGSQAVLIEPSSASSAALAIVLDVVHNGAVNSLGSDRVVA